MFESLQKVIEEPRFRISNIMIPWELVQTEPLPDDQDHAFENCAYWLGIFDYIPLTTQDGKSVRAILDMGTEEAVSPNDLLVKPSANLLEAFRIATNYEKTKPTLLLVGSVKHPRGIITHSDLNRSHFRLLLYTLFVTFEAKLSTLISSAGPNDWWRKHVSSKSLKELEKRHSQEMKLRIDLDKISCSHFTDKVRIIQKSETLRSQLGSAKASSLSSLVKWRNRLVHPTHPPMLVLNRSELPSLLKSVRTIDQIMPKLP